MTETLAELVAQHPLFEGLPGDVAGLVAGCARNVAFDAGDLLLVEGGAADQFFLLRRGEVAIEANAPGAAALTIETLEPGRVVGWSWLFFPYRWQFDARARGPVGAIAVDAQCLRQKAHDDPAFGYVLIERLAVEVLDTLQATRLRLLDLYGRDHGGGGD